LKSHWPLVELLLTELAVMGLGVWQLVSLARDKKKKSAPKK
jgi:hypothetical protein